MNHLTVGAPMPASLGGCVDLYHDLRELRLTMEKEVGPIKAREAEVREHLIEHISKQNTAGVFGQRFKATVPTSEKYTVKDWGVLHAWIRKNDRFDMLSKAISQTNVTAWVAENGRILPGCERIFVPGLSVTKV